MIEFILQLDLYLFHIINSNLNNPLFNNIFIFFHDCHKNIWFVLPLLFLWLFYIFKDKKNRMSLIILIPLSILITDQIGSKLKDLELRQRPYMVINEHEMNLVTCGLPNAVAPNIADKFQIPAAFAPCWLDRCHDRFYWFNTLNCCLINCLSRKN